LIELATFVAVRSWRAGCLHLRVGLLRRNKGLSRLRSTWMDTRLPDRM